MTTKHGMGRPLWVDAILLTVAAVIFITMLLLGNWQVKRLSWKLNLIAAVEARAFKAAIEPPIGLVTAKDHAYLRVKTEGVFRHDLSKRVKALTELGPGYWAMTPLETRHGGHIWINRGFIPIGIDQESWFSPEGHQQVEGLVRISQPDGTLLEKNDPKAQRWYSHDIAAMTADTELPKTALYFIDADHAGPKEAWPRGGLTIVKFRNPHLSYALTWYAMAALFLGAMVFVIYDRLKTHR
ncbi:MAG: SURF1 family protein [Pseudomonadota bacterium]